MKKLLILAVILLATVSTIYAQSFTVESVTGRVQRQSGTSWVDIVRGETLNANTTIRTQIGASLVVVQGNNTVTIPAGRNGRLADLVAGNVAAGGNVATADTREVERVNRAEDSASRRASIAVRAPSVAEDEEEE